MELRFYFGLRASFKTYRKFVGKATRINTAANTSWWDVCTCVSVVFVWGNKEVVLLA